jgi:glycosyltransferase involved in cell wall biosynthesis
MSDHGISGASIVTPVPVAGDVDLQGGLKRQKEGKDLHILILPSFYPTSQNPYSGTFFRDWAEALQGAGVKVGVAYVEGRGMRTLSVSAVRETHFQLTAGLEGTLNTVRLHGWNVLAQWTAGGLIWARLAQCAIGEYIRHYGRPDLVAAQSVTWAGEAARHAGKTWGIPYVITEVNTGFGTGRIRGWEATISRRAFTDAQAVIAISRNLRQRLVQFGGARRVELVPCTVNERYWTPPPRPRAASPFTFYAQAHLTPRKGFDILIRAFAFQFRGDVTVRLVIGGDGAIRQDLEALAESTGVRSQVTFLGAISRQTVREAMWAANCFVLPSLAENFGVVLIEALSTGLPVIATSCGGPEDFVDDRVGILLEPGDEAALADALATLRHATAFEQDAVRTSAIRRFGYDVVGAQLRDLYRSMLS